MRWIAKVTCLISLVSVFAGCTQQCFVSEADYNHYHHLPGALLENDIDAIEPTIRNSPPPKTVLDPEKLEPYHMTLAEAIAIALENGNTGIQSVRQPGSIQDDLISPNAAQQAEFQSTANRVLALNPAATGLGIEWSLARFDPVWATRMNWNFTDQQPQGLSSFQNGQFANFASELRKPLATGGVAGITFSTDYSRLSAPPTAFPIQNPAYLAKFGLTFEQPLWLGAGTKINQLLTRHPGSTQNTAASGFLNSRVNNNSGTTIQPQGILIARLRFDQSRAEFERNVNFKLLNVEVAYWNLYSAYVNMYAAEQGVKMSRFVWQNLKAKAQVGAGVIAEAARFNGQYRLFQGDRVAALGLVLERERNLRGLLGLPPEDGKQLIPIDAPTLAPYHPNWEAALQDTITLRPELIGLRQEVKARQLNIITQKEFLKPDLRFISQYEINGLGSRLDGDGVVLDQSTGQFRSDNAFRNLSSTHHNNWTVGLNLNVPLGYRLEYANVRLARLRLAQSFMTLKAEENKAERFLAKAWRDIFEKHELIKIRRAQRIAFAKRLEQEVALVQVGKAVYGEATLQAQRDWVNALQQEYQAIADYNNSLATFQFAKGTLMQHNSVHISEGPLPECAQVRAVEHERERSKAILLRERANPVVHTTCGPEGFGAIPQMPVNAAPSVPALLEGAKMPLEANAPTDGANATKSADPETLPLPPSAASVNPVPATELPAAPTQIMPTPPQTTTPASIQESKYNLPY